MSAVISSIVRCWSRVSGNGQVRDERRQQRAVDAVGDALLLRGERALARDEPDLHAQELVEHEAALRRCELRHRLGPVDRAQRDVPVDEVVAIEEVLVERVREPAHRAPRERVGDERAQLPREHLGLARLRIHRDDHAGLLVGGARPADHVDDRVRHLPLAAVHVELAEERGLGPDRRAASRATPG